MGNPPEVAFLSLSLSLSLMVEVEVEKKSEKPPRGPHRKSRKSRKHDTHPIEQHFYESYTYGRARGAEGPLKLAFSLAAITWFGSVSASISINRKPVIRR